MRERGGDEMQGFLFGKPVPGERMGRLMRPKRLLADASAIARAKRPLGVRVR